MKVQAVDRKRVHRFSATAHFRWVLRPNLSNIANRAMTSIFWYRSGATSLSAVKADCLSVKFVLRVPLRWKVPHRISCMHGRTRPMANPELQATLSPSIECIHRKTGHNLLLYPSSILIYHGDRLEPVLRQEVVELSFDS